MPVPKRKSREVRKPEVAPEAKPEVEAVKEVSEQKPESLPQEPAKEKEAAELSRKAAPVSDDTADEEVVEEKDELTHEVEEVLSEDLGEMYDKLSPDKQKEFQEKGEETAGKIRQMITTSKVKSRKVLGWIKDWIKMIPGVNKFFLEQEAKIKTDKILLMAEEEQKKHEGEIE